jgi:hypothetical protein
MRQATAVFHVTSQIVVIEALLLVCTGARSVGKMIVLPAFTSLSEDLKAASSFPQTLALGDGEFKAFFQLDSIGRPRVSWFATRKSHKEEEILLSSFSVVLVDSRVK